MIDYTRIKGYAAGIGPEAYKAIYGSEFHIPYDKLCRPKDDIAFNDREIVFLKCNTYFCTQMTNGDGRWTICQSIGVIPIACIVLDGEDFSDYFTLEES